MCCRYWVEESPELRPIVEEMDRSPLVKKWLKTAGIVRSGEVHPADIVPVLAPNKKGEPAIYPMRWGFREKSLIINARSESAAVKPTFKDAWASHRCIAPASWYYEWEHLIDNDGKKHTGRKYIIQPKGETVAWLCGLYRIEEGLPVFVVLTREAGGGIRSIHDRMPLILPERLVGEWIRPGSKPEELLGEALTEMVCEESQ